MAQISIVIPVYRVEQEYLRKCIESMVNQTLQEIEIIIVDDGTTQECKEICTEYAERDQRIRYLVQKNQGVSVARNQGIECATSPIITFVDADDWVEPHMCEIVKKEFELNSDIQICVFAAYLNSKEKEIKNPFWDSKRKLFQGEEKEQLQLQSISKNLANFQPKNSTVGTTWCKAYQRQWLEDEELYYEPELRRGQDTIFNLNAFEKARKVLYIDEYLYHYRLNSGSAVHRYTENAIKYLTRILQHTLNFIQMYHKSERFYQGYYEKCASLLITALGNDFLHKDNPKSFIVRRRELRAILKMSIYSEALRKVSFKNLNIKKKTLLFLMKYRLVSLLFIINKIYQMGQQ